MSNIEQFCFHRHSADRVQDGQHFYGPVNSTMNLRVHMQLHCYQQVHAEHHFCSTFVPTFHVFLNGGLLFSAPI